jgi:hypothetical protein
MGKAWGMLGKNAKTHYNNLGEKQRRSGKGAFENEINRIKSFKKSTEDYSVNYEQAHGDKVLINLIGGEEIFVETINEDGQYKIKDANTIKSLISAIAVEIEEDKGY